MDDTNNNGKNTFRLRNKRRMHGDVVGYRPYFIQREFLNANLIGDLMREQRIESDHSHSKCLHPSSHFATYASHSDYRQCFPRQLETGVQFSVPSSFLQRLDCLRNVSRQIADQRARQFASTDAVPTGSTEKKSYRSIMRLDLCTRELTTERKRRK